MKKRLICVLAVFTMVASLLAGCKSEKGVTEITLNEVAHSIFYAPMYVAFEKDYFKDEGLKVNLVNGLGADKTMTAVLSGDCEIGFMGAEASVYVYNEGAEDYVVNFAQLTQRAGNFLVSRDKNEDFKWANLKGKTVIGGRPGG
ncbi:MAG: ytlA [Herbinix sp.]|nr:ytlA [Herbinix sp.]